MSPSIWQILIVLAILVLLFGPSRIPGLGKSLGEAIRGFKKGLDGEKDEIDVTHTSRHSEQIKNDETEKTSESSKKETDKV